MAHRDGSGFPEDSRSGRLSVRYRIQGQILPNGMFFGSARADKRSCQWQDNTGQCLWCVTDTL